VVSSSLRQLSKFGGHGVIVGVAGGVEERAKLVVAHARHQFGFVKQAVAVMAFDLAKDIGKDSACFVTCRQRIDRILQADRASFLQQAPRSSRDDRQAWPEAGAPASTSERRRGTLALFNLVGMIQSYQKY